MSFKISKPALAPARGTNMQQPVEKLNMAMNLLGRVAGDPMQSAVRLGELFDAGLLRYNSGGLLVPGPALGTGSVAGIAFKNLLINGDFFWWQRGTSIGASTAARYLADRWVTISDGTTTAPSRQAFAAGQTDVPGNPSYFHRVVVASVAGAANFAVMEQRVEGVQTLAGQQCVISFYAKADAPKSLALDMYQSFGGGGSATVGGIGAQKFSLTTTWQKFVAVVTLPSIAGKVLGPHHYLDLRFWFDAGSAYNALNDALGQQSGTFDIAQVQVERGADATPFEVRPLGVELLLCQRYYEKSYNADVTPGTPTEFGREALYISSTASAAVYVSIRFKVPKRTPPNLAVFGSTNGALGVVCQDDGSSVGASWLNVGEANANLTWTNAGGRIGGFFHWAADAEI